MQINLVAVGTKMPDWVTQGYQEYASRLPKDFHLNLIEMPSLKRLKSSNLAALKIEEGQKLLKTIPNRNYIIALERQGKIISSEDIAKKMRDWQLQSLEVSFLIGGPEGLSEQCCDEAKEIWSLSALTLPHPLVRIFLAEQLYRAYTILSNHPYHR